MKLICDKCGEEFESGILNVLDHQFDKCKAHIVEKMDGQNISVKTMPFITPTPVTNNAYDGSKISMVSLDENGIFPL